MDVDAPKGEYDTDENYAVDYSNLKPELRLASDQAQRDRLDAEMRDECNERAATLEKLEPNMKALSNSTIKFLKRRSDKRLRLKMLEKN